MKNIENQLESYIEKMMFFQDIPGLAITITKDHQIIYGKGFGMKNINTKEPVTENTIFHMASITKLFVGTAIMQLVEKGLIDLQGAVTDYLPYFRLKDMGYRDMKIIQMLSHSSGMPDCKDYGWDKPQFDEGALERYVRSLENISLIGKSGERFFYSNIAYEVLGDVIAKVSGESFEDYIKNHILKPLGMNSSTLLLNEVKKENLASPHIKNEEKKVKISEIFPYNREHSPSSTLYSNILDIARWTMANLNRGQLDGIRILKDQTYDLLWNPVINIIKDKEQMGISWFLGSHGGYRIYGHEGSDIGFRTSLGLMPEKNISVCVLSNRSGASTKKIMKDIFDRVLSI